MNNVLVFPAGTEIAFEIHAALRNSKFIKLFGGTSVACHAEMVFENCIEDLPFVDSPDLIDALNEVVDEYGIDYIYPAHDSALLALTRARYSLRAKVVTSMLETVEVCRDKAKTYQYFDGAFYMPKVYKSVMDVDQYPVFAKPAVGQGSVGARIIYDDCDLSEISGKEYVICEYLPGKEYTVDCFTDIHGKLRYVGQRTRERIRAGIAVRSRIIRTMDVVQRIAEDINSQLCFNGAWFFQLKEDENGALKLLEIAPRIAGTMGLTRNLGVNMPLLTMYNMWEQNVEILNNGNRLLLDRAFVSRFQSDIEYGKVYIDFDDTLIFRGKVNPFLMAFLYQSCNKGKQLCLLTRNNNAAHRLSLYEISPYLFTKIIYVGEGKSKADYVDGNSILIDDSFRERKEVHDRCGIPVFDLDMVESLYDWRM